MERPPVSFTRRWCSWLSRPRDTFNFVLITRSRTAGFAQSNVGYQHRGRMTFR